MLENHFYNLMQQLVEESKGLWRIRKMYRQDSSNCQMCQDFWDKLEKKKESQVRELEKLVKAHIAASK